VEEALVAALERGGGRGAKGCQGGGGDDGEETGELGGEEQHGGG